MKRLWVRWSLLVSIHLPKVLLTEGQVKSGDGHGRISLTNRISNCLIFIKKRLVWKTSQTTKETNSVYLFLYSYIK